MDPIQKLFIDVVKQLIDIFDCCLYTHWLNRFNKIFLGYAWIFYLFLFTENVKDTLKSDLIGIPNWLDLWTSSGQDWVDKATLEESNIYSLARHKVNEIFVSDLKFVLVGKTHVFHDSLGLELTKSNP